MELTKNIRVKRLQLEGHVMRMDERVPKNVLKGYIEGRRSVGRPRGRWIDAVEKDTKNVLKYKNWRTSADVDVWIEEAKV
jgi:hypothetical protein